jgi:membrane protease YdiL (CAAX protease family)
MFDEQPTFAEVSPPETSIRTPSEAKQVRRFEVFLVLLVSFGTFFLSSLQILITGQSTTPRLQGLRYTGGIIQEISGLLLLGYVLCRRRKKLVDLGFRWSLRSVITGTGIAVVSYIAYVVGSYIIFLIHKALFSSASSPSARTDFLPHRQIMAIPFFLLNPFFEELIVRAYLMTEVEALTGSWRLAAVVSVAVQFSYHLYYGWQGALAVSIPFVVFSIYYAKTRQAMPIVIAHAAFDLWGLTRLW